MDQITKIEITINEANLIQIVVLDQTDNKQKKDKVSYSRDSNHASLMRDIGYMVVSLVNKDTGK